MYYKVLKAASLTLAVFSAFFLLAAVGLFFFRVSDFTERCIASYKKLTPLNSFQQKREAYDAIGEPVLVLNFFPPQLRVPDLRSMLIYYGRNGRPDANGQNPKLHFTLNGMKTIHSALAGQKVYLNYDKKLTPCKYSFSPDNAETHLWFIAQPEGNNAVVTLFMKNENGEVISDPPTLANFSLQEKEFIRFAGTSIWEIGKWRVDGTLLARQKARWYGPDRFLERHGGEEFTDILGKQRIDFEDSDNAYSVFVKAGDCLVWNQDRWEPKLPGIDSMGMPMMCVKKIDERVMNLELWDVEGKGKVILNLIKSQENLVAQQFVQDFKFLGARTRTQCVFQVNQARMILKPNDWFLLTDGSWKKLTTMEEIDDYVNRRTTGTLFVFDEIRKGERPVLVGTVFNPTRTEMDQVEIAMQTTAVVPVPGLDPKAQTAKEVLPFPVNAPQFNLPNINPLATH